MRTAPRLSEEQLRIPKVISNLPMMQEVTIKESDKGGYIVVLEYKHYETICWDILRTKKL